jgi:hypothetical protein
MSIVQFYALYFSVAYVCIWAIMFVIYGMRDTALMACGRAIITSAKLCISAIAFLVFRYFIGLMY